MDLLVGGLVGIYPATAYLPVVTWSLITTVLLVIAIRIAPQRVWLAIPFAVLGALVLLIAVVSTRLPSFAVPFLLFIQAGILWRVFRKPGRRNRMLFEGYSDSDVQRWLLLRALEWVNLPTFASRATVPLFLIVFPWQYVFLAFALAILLWLPLRHKFVSVLVARVAIFLGLFAWPAAIGSAAYLLYHGHYILAVVAVIWPFASAFVQLPGRVGEIKLAFAFRVGYLSADAQADI